MIKINNPRLKDAFRFVSKAKCQWTRLPKTELGFSRSTAFNIEQKEEHPEQPSGIQWHLHFDSVEK